MIYFNLFNKANKPVPSPIMKSYIYYVYLCLGICGVYLRNPTPPTLSFSVHIQKELKQLKRGKKLYKKKQKLSLKEEFPSLQMKKEKSCSFALLLHFKTTAA